MPQYAGTRQKAADVIIEVENGKPVRIARADGNFLTFDKKGQVHRDLVAGGMEAMETFAALERAERRPSSKVVDLAPKLKREKWERDNRWTLSKQDLDFRRHLEAQARAHIQVPTSQGCCSESAPYDVRGKASHSRNANPYLRD